MALNWEKRELPVLRWVHTDLASDVLDLHYSDNPAEFLPEITERQVDEALRRLKQRCLIAGEREEDQRGMSWSKLRVKANGLRELGAWPPDEDSARDDVERHWSVWTTRDKPMLRRLLKSAPPDGILCVSDPECGSVLTLSDAGYVTWTECDAEGGGGWMFFDVLVTSAGKQVLGL